MYLSEAKHEKKDQDKKPPFPRDAKLNHIETIRLFQRKSKNLLAITNRILTLFDDEHIIGELNKCVLLPPSIAHKRFEAAMSELYDQQHSAFAVVFGTLYLFILFCILYYNN